MSGLMEFLAMGGRGAYVWSAFAISLLALALEGRSVMSRNARARRDAIARAAAERVS